MSPAHKYLLFSCKTASKIWPASSGAQLSNQQPSPKPEKPSCVGLTARNHTHHGFGPCLSVWGWRGKDHSRLTGHWAYDTAQSCLYRSKECSWEIRFTKPLLQSIDLSMWFCLPLWVGSSRSATPPGKLSLWTYVCLLSTSKRNEGLQPRVLWVKLLQS